MSDFYIRKVEESELEKCAEVIRRSFSTVAADFNLTPENCPTHRSFIKSERLISDRNAGIIQFGLFTAEILTGFMCLKKIDNNTYELEMLSVLPEYRHHGYGRALIDFAKNKVKSMGGNKITIDIIEENKILKDWYFSNGFVHTGTKIYPHLPFTAGYMECNI